MRRLGCWMIPLALVLGIMAHRLEAQQTTPDIEPEALAALKSMGGYLRTLKAFRVLATVTTEEVLLNGQKVQIASVTDLLARMPDRLRADVKGDWKERLFVYNGKTFTLLARRLGYYATVPARPTITEVANNLEDNYNIEIPLVDLFRWGGPRSSIDEITAATDIGASAVNGVTCEQYAFRQPGLDWQIWIQQGDFPLPRKLVLTTLTDEARPQFIAVYDWDLAPSFNDAAFEFVPPPEAHKIVMAEVGAASAGSNP